jgi:hypothetical protein
LTSTTWKLFIKAGCEPARTWKILAAEIAAKGTSIIPELTLVEILNATEKKKDELKGVGCFVVRDAVPRSEATTWVNGLKKYVTDNKDAITGQYIPANSPSVVKSTDLNL